MRPYLITRFLARHIAHIGLWVGYMFAAIGDARGVLYPRGCASMLPIRTVMG